MNNKYFINKIIDQNIMTINYPQSLVLREKKNFVGPVFYFLHFPWWHIYRTQYIVSDSYCEDRLRTETASHQCRLDSYIRNVFMCQPLLLSTLF